MNIHLSTFNTFFYPKAVIIYSMIIALITVGNLQYDNYFNIGSDGLGYYAYLPAIFINDNLQNLEEDVVYTNTINGRVVNKYFIGTAVLMAPFFSVAYIVSQGSSYASNGYSRPFQFLIAIGALFYLWLGLWFINELLKSYRIKPIHRSIAIVAILFGTNLFYYGVISTSMSHVYSFTMICGFLYYGRNFFINHDSKYIYGLSLFMALIVLIRPINGLIFFVLPFLADSPHIVLKRFQHLFNQKFSIIAASLIFLGLLSIQFWAWKVQAGSFIIWSYKGEGFYWFQPRIFSFLLSIKKGLFVYTPVLILSLIGMLRYWRKNKFITIGFFTTTALMIYVLSSWWNWQYGNGFGQRAMIDFYGFFALAIGLLLKEIQRTFWIRIINSFILLCVMNNVLQSYQFFHHIIHSSSMTAEKYAYVFLKTNESYAYSLGGLLDLPPYSSTPKRLIYSSTNDFENSYEGWSGGEIGDFKELCDNITIENHSCFYHKNEFGSGLTLKKDIELVGTGKLYVELRLKLMTLTDEGAQNAQMVLTTGSSSDQITYYKSFKLEEVPSKRNCEWRSLHSTIALPMLRNENEALKIYIWNSAFQEFLVDDFEVSVYRVE